MENENVLFDERFLEKYVGLKLLNNPIYATIELIANSWDAGATKVEIFWPSEENDYQFSIKDNGIGITRNEFEVIWKTLSYNRVKDKGIYADSIDSNAKKRVAFGRNGIGRFSAFCFANEYEFISTKNGKNIKYIVKKENGNMPFSIKLIDESDVEQNAHSAEIRTYLENDISVHVEQLRSEISMRFVADPEFEIFINRKKLSIEDISAENISKEILEIGNLGKIEIFTIDTVETDKTTKLHGLAWRVNNRLVGDISWDFLSNKYNVDGRRIESKRYSFVINANIAKEAILPDWSGFDIENPITEEIEKNVYPFIWEKLVSLNKDKRKQELDDIKKSLNKTYKRMTPIRQEMWEKFIIDIQESCPSLTHKELKIIAEILAKLEISKDKYALLENLNQLNLNQMDDLNEVLNQWTIDYAKVVLDELKSRIELLNELENKLYSKKADEVHELQPLFHRGLWIFGPEYETIEYTSNRGMTTVIQKLFGAKVKASLNRPDFAILTDSTVGLYSYPEYDDEGSEIGIDKLTIVELKAPGVPLKEDEIEQPWKYVKELYKQGIIKENYTKVTCFIVGQNIDQYESGERKKANDTVILKPLIYDTVIRRAKSRLFKLYDRMKDAPFMNNIDVRYTEYFDKNVLQPELAASQE